jgi:hypothetical protein
MMRAVIVGSRPRQITAALAERQADCTVAVDGNSCSVPSRLIPAFARTESVRVVVLDGRIRVHHAGAEGRGRPAGILLGKPPFQTGSTR